MADHALIVGATGIIGGALVQRLVDTGGWAICGLARHAQGRPGVDAIQVDLTDASTVKQALTTCAITHAFFCTWSRQATEAENCQVNGAMLRNVLDALGSDTLRHVALVTGTKHYLGPFEAFGKRGAETPFRETQPRLPVENFYYVQEDILFEAAARGRFTWSVHRPHTVSTERCSGGGGCGTRSRRISNLRCPSIPATRRHSSNRCATPARSGIGSSPKYGLERNPIDRVASWWHSDADLGRTLETFNDMSKSRRLGFLEYQETVGSFADTFSQLRVSIVRRQEFGARL